MTTTQAFSRFLNANGFSSPETIEWDEEALEFYSLTSINTQKILEKEHEPEVRKCFLETVENMGMFPFLATFRPDLYDLIEDGSHTWEEYEHCLQYWNRYKKTFLPLIQEAVSKLN